MTDEWERRHGLNPRDPADGLLVAPSGYTWVEEYLNGIARWISPGRSRP